MSAQPTALVTISPTGHRIKIPRDYMVTVEIKLSSIDPKFADKEQVGALVRAAFEAFAPAAGEPDRRIYNELIVTRTVGAAKVVHTLVTGQEGYTTCAGRPSVPAIEKLVATLEGAGYRLSVVERRACHEEGCMSDAVVDWSRPTQVPPLWYNETTCGRHDYKTCETCQSVFALRSESASGQAPSVHCSICGTVLVEWGSSKLWTAELIADGPRSSPRN